MARRDPGRALPGSGLKEPPIRSRFSAGAAIAGILIGIQVVVLLVVAARSEVRGDEIEHLHAAWHVARGEVPYRDFFEHHNPLLWYVLAPVVAALPERFEVVLAGRALIVLFQLALVPLVAYVAAQLAGGAAGLWAAASLLSFAPFLERGLQVRPDTPMLFFGMLAFALGFPSSARGGPRRAFLAGAAWGVSFLFLQKALFLLPPVAALLLVPGSGTGRASAASGPASIDRPDVRRRALAMAAGGALPIAALLAGLVASGTLAAWWYWCFPFNRTVPFPEPGIWTRGLAPLELTLRERNTVLSLVAALGAAWILLRGTRAGRLAVLPGLFFGMLLVLVGRRPYPQYLLPLLVFLSIAAGLLLVRLEERLARVSAPLRIAVLALLAVGIGSQHAVHRFRERGSSWLPARAEYEYVRSRTSGPDRVYDPRPRFNIHRPDIDYFWLRPGQIVGRHRALGGRSGFDLGERIRAAEPAFVAFDAGSIALRDSLVAAGTYREVPGLRLLERTR